MLRTEQVEFVVRVDMTLKNMPLICPFLLYSLVFIVKQWINGTALLTPLIMQVLWCITEKQAIQEEGEKEIIQSLFETKLIFPKPFQELMNIPAGISTDKSFHFLPSNLAPTALLKV